MKPVVSLEITIKKEILPAFSLTVASSICAGLECCHPWIRRTSKHLNFAIDSTRETAQQLLFRNPIVEAPILDEVPAGDLERFEARIDGLWDGGADAGLEVVAQLLRGPVADFVDGGGGHVGAGVGGR
jgi:hypothetical protein